MTSQTRASSSCCSYYSKGRRDKKEKKVDLVTAVRPTNAEEERIKFFSAEEENYEPQFLYSISTQLLEKTLKRHHAQVQVERRYIPHALRILHTLLQKYGSYDNYQEQVGGHEVTIEEALPMVNEYVGRLGVENELTVVFDPTLVARASFVKGASVLNIRPQGLRRNWVNGMLHHEVGTHFLRDKNDKMQTWAREKNGRRRYRLEDKNPTEEGLASIHTVLEREGHCLWRPALLYYATWRALQLSFRDLYEDLGQFLGSSSDERWDYCVRAKRGLFDTSQLGGFAKDQAYLAGAMEILEQRRKIDFTSLYAGKISVLDSHRVRSTGLARLGHLHLPVFLQGSEQRARYMELLDEIVHDNGLSALVDRVGVDAAATHNGVSIMTNAARQHTALAQNRISRLALGSCGLEPMDFSLAAVADRGVKGAAPAPIAARKGLSLNLAATFSGCIGDSCGCCSPRRAIVRDINTTTICGWRSPLREGSVGGASSTPVAVALPPVAPPVAR